MQCRQVKKKPQKRKKKLENVTHLRLFQFRHSSAGTCQRRRRVQSVSHRQLGPHPDDRTSRRAHCSPRSRRDRPQAAAIRCRRSWDGNARQCPWVPLVAVNQQLNNQPDTYRPALYVRYLFFFNFMLVCSPTFLAPSQINWRSLQWKVETQKNESWKSENESHDLRVPINVFELNASCFSMSIKFGIQARAVHNTGWQM